ncbi:MAG: CYTH domain-containing protein [Candidatus Hydrothermarchaeota archaeon]|nr:CYTH domain-containing protein [Candidatus Hydrothermarchaeota archaeon]
MEIEVKIRVPSLKEFEEKIKSAKFVGEETQTDTYFRMPEKEPPRVGESDNGATLGYKGIKDDRN